ncbi:M20/M25/M40 family metallo-hydrolase, partial [bacterium]|nr:M20/M25/M40 family metallo-hydrolase [bacterium]
MRQGLTNSLITGLIAISVIWSGRSFGQNEVVMEVKEYRQKNEKRILTELVELLKIPNVARDRDNIRRNVDHLIKMLGQRGVTNLQVLEAGGGSPSVYGELKVPGATKTVVMYMHFDGQPVNQDNWDSDPWQPIFRDKLPGQGGKTYDLSDLSFPVDPEWRLYARSASDDKSPIVAALTAMDALEQAKIPLSVNLKFFLEGEEEAGSGTLDQILEKYAGLLGADVWIFCDGPVHQTRRKKVSFGVRGVTGVTMRIYGPNRPLHSGHYGNWAPNPIMMLADLLTTMRDTEGKILIDGFYEDVNPITETERRALTASPDIDQQMLAELSLARSEGVGRLEERIMLPALNLRKISAGGAAARNAIQTDASTALGFRLVPAQTREKVRERVEAHIRGQGYHIVYEDPDHATRRA